MISCLISHNSSVHVSTCQLQTSKEPIMESRLHCESYQDLGQGVGWQRREGTNGKCVGNVILCKYLDPFETYSQVPSKKINAIRPFEMVCGLSEINPICKMLPRPAKLDRKQVSPNKALFKKKKLMRHRPYILIFSGKYNWIFFGPRLYQTCVGKFAQGLRQVTINSCLSNIYIWKLFRSFKNF